MVWLGRSAEANIVKITFADVRTRVPLRLSRLVSPTLHYVSISLLFISHFNAFFFFVHCLNILVRR